MTVSWGIPSSHNCSDFFFTFLSMVLLLANLQKQLTFTLSFLANLQLIALARLPNQLQNLSLDTGALMPALWVQIPPG